MFYFERCSCRACFMIAFKVLMPKSPMALSKFWFKNSYHKATLSFFFCHSNLSVYSLNALQIYKTFLIYLDFCQISLWFTALNYQGNSGSKQSPWKPPVTIETVPQQDCSGMYSLHCTTGALYQPLHYTSHYFTNH